MLNVSVEGCHQATLARLVDAGALPVLHDTPASMATGMRLLHNQNREIVSYLERLSRADLVDCVFYTDSRSTWRLTEHALKELELCVLLEMPEPLFATRFVSLV